MRSVLKNCILLLCFAFIVSACSVLTTAKNQLADKLESGAYDIQLELYSAPEVSSLEGCYPAEEAKHYTEKFRSIVDDVLKTHKESQKKLAIGSIATPACEVVIDQVLPIFVSKATENMRPCLRGVGITQLQALIRPYCSKL